MRGDRAMTQDEKDIALVESLCMQRASYEAIAPVVDALLAMWAAAPNKIEDWAVFCEMADNALVMFNWTWADVDREIDRRVSSFAEKKAGY